MWQWEHGNRMTDERPKPATSEAALQILITEHTNLQAIRSATVFEANGRTTLFLGAVSSAVVALAFVGQVSEMGSAFRIFALILLPSLIFIGVVTFVRVYQTGLEDMIASRGINRIRHYYTEVAPDIEKYFILSTHDDMQGVLQNMGAQEPGWWQLFVSTHGLVSVINSVLAAVFVGLLVSTLFGLALLGAVIAGIIIFVLSVMLHFRYQSRTFDAVEKNLHVLFPSASEGEA
jgi:hypothetical protein